MKKTIILSGLFILTANTYANELNVKITSLTNIKGNGAMEVCGKVENQIGKTSLVSIKHETASYTTLTDIDGKWCQVIKRWSFNGETNATVREL